MSDTINDASIKLSIDADGVEVGLQKIEAAGAKTGRTLENLGKSDGFTKLGDGAEVAANKFAFGTKGIIDAIEKRTSAMELGKRGTVEYYTALANQKGINADALKPYLDRLDSVTKKTNEAAEALRKADDGAKFVEGLRARAEEIGKSAAELATMRAAQLGVTESAAPFIAKLQEAEEAAGGLGGVLGITTGAVASFLAGLAGAVSIGGFTSIVDSAITSLADLDDMAQKSGSSVETLSRLQKVAQATGQDFGQVDSAISKLAKGMGGLDEDSNKVVGALKRLGISTKDIANQDPSEVLIKASSALQKYSDGAGKTALINDLLGKSGADLLPYLNDVSELVGQFGGSSDEAAKKATEFGVNLGIMRVRVGEMGNIIASNLLPYLLKFSEYVKRLAESEKFKKFLVDTGSAIGQFASFVVGASTAIVPAAKITAAYFAVFVAAPAIITAVGTAFTALRAGVAAATLAASLSGGVWAALTTQLWGTSLAATAATGAMGALKVASGFLFAGFAGLQFGSYLRDQFVEVRVAAADFVGNVLIGIEKVKFHMALAGDAIKFAWDSRLGEMKLLFAGYIDSVGKGLQQISGGKLGSGVIEYAESLRTSGNAQVALANQTVKGSAEMIRAHDATLAAIKKNISEMVTYELTAGNAAAAVTAAGKAGGKGGLSGGGDGGAAASKMKEAYQSLTQSIREKIAAAEAEANGQANLSESQKLQISLDSQLATGKLKLADADLKRYQTSIAELAAQEEIIASNKRALAGATEFARMQKAVDDQAANRLAGMAKEADQNEELARTYGMTKLQIEELTLARLEDQLAQRASNSLTLKEMEDLESEIAARKRSRDALRAVDAKDTSKKANEAMLSDWKRTVEKYDDVFRTGFADMLNEGKDGWKAFTKSLVTTFKTSVADQIYKMFAQPFVMKLVASLIGVTGGGSASASGIPGIPGAPGASAGGDLVSQAKAAYDAISAGFSGISTSVADGVQAGMNATGMSSNILSNGPVANAAGQFAGMAAGYAAGSALNKAISGGYETGSGFMKAEKVATAVASYFNPALGAVVGAVSGVINRAFGMKDKVAGESSIVGNLGMNGFSGSTDTPWTQKGGWFRSNKSGVDKVAIDSTAAKQFASAYESIKFASADFAKTLGLNADAIRSRTQQVSIALTKDHAANEKSIADFFTGVADKIATELLPNLAEFAKQNESAAGTLARVSSNYAFLDVALNAIGKTFGAVGVGSISAREHLVELVGGLDVLGNGTAFFAQNFMSEAERLAPVAEQVTSTLASLGLSFVDTRDEFKNVVLGLDLTSSSGASTYAALMKVQDAFAMVYPAAEATNDALTQRIELQKEYDDLTKTAAQKLADQRAATAPANRALFDQVQGFKALKVAQDAARASLSDVTSRMRSLGDSARDLGKGLLLGDLSTLTPEQQYSESKRQYETTLVAAKGGDARAQDQFASIATTFLEASQRINGGDSMYAADFAGVIKTSEEIAKWSDSQIDVAQASLDALNAQVAALGQLNATMTALSQGVTVGALVPPPPRPFADGPNYNTMGTLNMAPMVDELKAVREQLRVQTEKSEQLAAASIEANAKVTLLAARLGAEGMDAAMNNQSWNNRNGKVVPV